MSNVVEEIAPVTTIIVGKCVYCAKRFITVFGDGIIDIVEPDEHASRCEVEIVFRESTGRVIAIDSIDLAFLTFSEKMYTLLRFLATRECHMQDHATEHATPLPETRVTLRGTNTCFIEVNGVNLLHVPVDPQRIQLPRFLRDRELGLRGTDRRFVRQGATITPSLEQDALWPIHWQQALWRACTSIWEYIDCLWDFNMYVHIPTGVGTYTDIMFLGEEFQFHDRSDGVHGVLLRGRRRARSAFERKI